MDEIDTDNLTRKQMKVLFAMQDESTFNESNFDAIFNE